MTVVAGATTALGLGRWGSVLASGGHDPVLGRVSGLGLLVTLALVVRLLQQSPGRWLAVGVTVGVLVAVGLGGGFLLLAFCPWRL
jgi:hypothetical protein